MSTINEILQALDHRPWEMPQSQWTYYQEWNGTLFLHWKVPGELLRPLVPEQLDLDTYNNETWVSVVAFTMERIRPKCLTAIGFISNFHEINLRTYVRLESKPGVYFLNIEAGNPLSTYIAGALSGLPYETASISRWGGAMPRYTAINRKRAFYLNASFRVGNRQVNKSNLDVFLSEKYCLYMEKSGQLFRYDIHHQPWDLYKIEHIDLKIAYRVGKISLIGRLDLMHYSDGVRVIAWNKVPVC